MLGEMTTALPHVRSFTEFARAGLGEGAGFVVGWLYWYFWVLVVPVEAIAGAKILHTWIPAFSRLQICIGLMSVMTCVNLMSARSYAEFEFSVCLHQGRAIRYSLPSRRRTPLAGPHRTARPSQSGRSWRIYAE
jgi:L-asparagine transporter-like permease